MSKLQKIYIVTGGDYSDYGTYAVFSKKKTAQRFINSFPIENRSHFRIEPRSIDYYDNVIKDGRKPYFVRMSKEGDTLKVYHTAYVECILKYGFDMWNNLYVDCFARDDKHAVKIANKIRIQLIATNKWGTK